MGFPHKNTPVQVPGDREAQAPDEEGRRKVNWERKGCDFEQAEGPRASLIRRALKGTFCQRNKVTHNVLGAHSYCCICALKFTNTLFQQLRR